MLTSFAGVSANGSLPPTTDTDIGQPDNDSSCSGCCSNTVGKFFRAGPNQTAPIAALVKLKDDQKWLAELLQVGLILGTAEVQGFEVATGHYSVRKYGAGTRLTGGVIVAIGGVEGDLPDEVKEGDAMLIRPHPNPLKPGEDICFSHFLDRGAAVVNDDGKIVGLLYGEVELPAGSQKIVHGVATPIRIAIDQLNALGGINVQVAPAQVIDKVQTTTNRVATVHHTSTPPIVTARREQRDTVPSSPIFGPELGDALAWLQDELSESVGGRLAIALWSEHRAEIRHLVARNRKVATAWHRSGGPALLQALSRAFHLPSVILPTTVNGRPIAECVDRLARVVCKYASPGLRTDIAALRAVLLPIGGQSIAELLMRLNRG